MRQPQFANAVKAFIVKYDKVLVIKRRPNDVHKPGLWDIPGGRLGHDENPILGLKREVKEETQLAVEIVMPIDVRYFKRDDGQQIYLTVFWCRPLSKKIILSDEHTEYKWLGIDSPKTDFPAWLYPIIKNFKTYINDKTISR